MMNAIEKLVVALTVLAEEVTEWVKEQRNKPSQLPLPMTAEAAPAPKKERKARVQAKAEKPELTPEPSVDDMMGLEAKPEEKKAESKYNKFSDEKLLEKVFEVTRAFIEKGENNRDICCNRLVEVYKAKKLPELSREGQIAWIADMEERLA